MPEPLAERLSNEDFNAIVAWVADLPEFDSDATRRTVYVVPAFQGRPGAAVIRRNAPVQGGRSEAATALVEYFAETYGPVAAGVESLGVFLGHATSRAPARGREIWDLIERYGMLDGDPALAERLRDGRQAHRPHGEAGPDAAAMGSSSGAVRGVLRSIRDAVLADGAAAVIAPADVDAGVRHAPSDWPAYRLQRIAFWKQPKYDRNVDRRFTRLTLLIDQGEHAQGGRWAGRPNGFDDLREVLKSEEVKSRSIVVLGLPGVGKTTLLRRLELDWAIDGIAAPEATPLTFFAALGEYRDRSLGPRAWLAARWQAAYPHLPPFDDVLRGQPLVLLLDALNEMPHTGPQDYAERVRAWREELETLATEHPGVRCVFTCRSLDYSASLSTDTCQVPHVRVEGLDDEQMQAFLGAYLPDPTQTPSVWRRLQALPKLLDLCRTPYYLNLLAEQVEPGGDLPSGRAALFTGFIRRALKREIDGEHPRFAVGTLLTAKDHMRFTRGDPRAWPTAFTLPDDGALVRSLETLADSMQRLTKADDGSQIVVPHDDAVAWLDQDGAGEILSAGADLGVLDVDEFEETVRFAHQLMQEYFAARVQSRTPDPALLRSPWRAADVAEPLADTLNRIAEADPLPPLPATGWEETAVMAAEMMKPEAADAYVTALTDMNLVAAARCATAPDVPIAEARRVIVRKAVAVRMGDPAADLRARIAAGLVLGDFGDPVDLGFVRRRGPYGDFLMPPMVAVPASPYPIGSNDHWDNERPVHKVPLWAFEIGRHPVTNAEYKCFIEGKGYADDRWWETDDARAWLRGDGALVEATKKLRRAEWAEYPKDDEGFHEWRRVRPSLTQSGIEWIDWFRQLSEAELEEVLADWYPAGSRRASPSLWNDSQFNGPLQPVVGVTWYEACAFARWLTEQSEQAFDLPSEVQTEAAARGVGGRAYAYGAQFDSALCNTYETHIRGTTPVGVFPTGGTPDGIVDLTGNVWEWTRSLWGTDPKRIDDRYRYPYDPTDAAREDPNAPVECLRVVRGGSWGSDHDSARAAYRLGGQPSSRNNDLGFRLVVSSPI